MTPNEYQSNCLRTWTANTEERELLANAALGLAGEAGEAVDLLKKSLFHGHALDKEKLAKELGDVCYYAAVMASEIGFSFEVVLQMNIDKLRTRYPDGFSSSASQARLDVVP